MVGRGRISQDGPVTRSRWLTYAALAAADTYLAGRPEPAARKARWVTKTALMPTLAAAAKPGLATSRLKKPTLAGLAFGWGGDVALLVPGTTPFLAGAGSFGVGHLAYVAGFRKLKAAGSPLTTPAGKAVATGWAAGAPVIVTGAARKAPVLAAVSGAYSLLLPTMTACALHLDPGLDRTARRLIGAGGIAFLASDMLLGLREFVLQGRAPWVERGVMATYTLGQGLIAAGATRA